MVRFSDLEFWHDFNWLGYVFEPYEMDLWLFMTSNLGHWDSFRRAHRDEYGNSLILGFDEWEQKSVMGERLVGMEERSMSAETPRIEALLDG